MSEFQNPEGDRQDPAEQYRVDTEVETSEQPTPDPVVETGGDLTGAEPAPSSSQEVAPETPDNDVAHEVSPAEPVREQVDPGLENGRTTIGGHEYEVTPEGGRRRVESGQPTVDTSQDVDDEGSDEG